MTTIVNEAARAAAEHIADEVSVGVASEYAPEGKADAYQAAAYGILLEACEEAVREALTERGVAEMDEAIAIGIGVAYDAAQAEDLDGLEV